MATAIAGLTQTSGTVASGQNGRPLVIPVHATVRGRLRLHVPYLLGSKQAKCLIERELSLNSGVQSVTANPITGNVLVLYDPTKNQQDVTKTLEQIVVNNTGNASNHRGNTSNAFDLTASDVVSDPNLSVRSRSTIEQWHLLNADDVLSFWESNKTTGLTSVKAGERLKRFGPNILSQSERRSILEIFVNQFKNLPVSLLLGSAALSLLTGGVADAIVILAVVLINAGIGVVTEYHSEKTIHALTQTTHSKISVLRDRKWQPTSIDKVVPGDILALTPGDHVPADCRLLEARTLRLNEATLTGESFPVTKAVAGMTGAEIPIADRINMVYRGTVVTGGSGVGMAVATGKQTEMGNIQALMSDAKPPVTPMQRQLDQIGKRMVYLSGATCGAIFLLGLARGYGFLQTLKTVVALAVAAVPEGLPTVATTTLSLGIRKMRRKGVLVRHLDAVEGLGAVQVLCLDKTGTLTESRMTVQSVLCGLRRITVDDDGFRSGESEVNPYADDDLLRLIHVAVLCNEVEIHDDNGRFILNGSPTEGALMQMAIIAGVAIKSLRALYTRLKIEYRTEGRNFMSILFDSADGGRLLAVKGNPEEVMERCRWVFEQGKTSEITPEMRTAILSENERMAGEALRVLGFAYSRGKEPEQILDHELTWLGLAGMADPIRPGMEQAISDLQQAGIKTVMITGDQSQTAYAIGKKLKLSRTSHLEMLDSAHVERLNPELLAALAQKVDIFSRVSPGHKLEIVQALQQTGQVVAMTGDGINDGPALKAADIGIAMGTNGTEAARSVADVVLENDDLRTVIIAVSEGRTIYNNIRKSVHFLMSTNLSEILLVLGSVGAGLGQPLNPMQLLWINLLTDVFPALALSVEPPEPDVLLMAPRDPEKSIISNSDLKRYGLESLSISASTLAAYGYGIARYGFGAQASTIAFMNLTLAQLLQAYSCRSESRVVSNSGPLKANPYLHLAVGGSLVLQLLSVLSPALRRLLGTAPLQLIDLLTIAGGAVVPFVINESTKTAMEPTVGN
jgi:P-type Ca2+ transporter type 2C